MGRAVTESMQKGNDLARTGEVIAKSRHRSYANCDVRAAGVCRRKYSVRYLDRNQVEVTFEVVTVLEGALEIVIDRAVINGAIIYGAVIDGDIDWIVIDWIGDDVGAAGRC